jgi:hypothetical protein
MAISPHIWHLSWTAGEAWNDQSSVQKSPAEDEQHERHSENLPLILNPEKTSGLTWPQAQDPQVNPYRWNLLARQIQAVGDGDLVCDFLELSIGDQNEYDDSQSLFYLESWETRWADPDTGDLARILKWLTVAFRGNYPDRIRGFCDLWDCVWQFRFRQASCARMRLVEVDSDIDRARVNLSWWACEVCRIRRLGKKRQGLCLCIWKYETRLTRFDLLN